jgi:hypothetical protein
MTARCVRCPAILRHTATHSFEHSIALTAAALVLLTIMCATPLMGVEKAAISRSANLFSGPAELARQGMSPLAAVVLFVTVVAPFGKLIGTLYVLIAWRGRDRPGICAGFPGGRKAASMVDDRGLVFMFVACVKLSDLVIFSSILASRDGADRGADLGRYRTRPGGGLEPARPRERKCCRSEWFEPGSPDRIGRGGAARLRYLRAGQRVAARRPPLPALRGDPAYPPA